MPELPEVETVRRTLENYIIGHTIESIDVFYSKVIDGDVKEFTEQLMNKAFTSIERKGKYLVFILDDIAFISHLRMEGKYHIVEKGSVYPKHTHVVFHMDDFDLLYIDVRKFGRMQLCDPHHYLDTAPINKLADEPFTIDENELYSKLHQSSLPIKTALLDQTIISGLGNIYVNEVLFRVGLVPTTKSKYLTKKTVHLIKTEAIQVLNEAISQGGTTIRSFDNNGIHGLFQVKLNVHEQKNCKKCGSEIKKIKVNGRGTYYCPNCQKKRR